MTDRREEIRSRLEKASPEPWHIEEDWTAELLAGAHLIAKFVYPSNIADAQLCAHAPSDIRFLLDDADARIERCTNCGSEEMIEELRAKHHDAIACCPEREMQPIKLLDEIARLKTALAAAEERTEKAERDLTSYQTETAKSLRLNRDLWEQRARLAEARVAVLAEALKTFGEILLAEVPTGLRAGKLTLWFKIGPEIKYALCVAGNSYDEAAINEIGGTLNHATDILSTLPARAAALIAERKTMRKALEGIDTFAWSSFRADCTEAVEEGNRRINACKSALRALDNTETNLKESE